METIHSLGMYLYIYIYIYIIIYIIKILVVCPSVCDACGRGRNGFAGRVQNHHVHFSFHVYRTRNGHINLS